MNLRALAAALAFVLPLLAHAQAPAKPQAQAQAQQVLVVDDAHTQVDVPKGKENPAYKLAPGTGLVIDAHKYSFKLRPELAGAHVNSLQLILDKDQQYDVLWDPKQNATFISAQTARPLAGSKPFTGFVAGQKVVIALGVLKGKSFEVVWVGLADVK